MSSIENAIGKKIQITNAGLYNRLGEKIDLLTGLNYDSLLLSMDNIASLLAENVGLDSKKTQFLVAMYGLGCVDGGKLSIDYFNSRVLPNKRLLPYDIMSHNLKTIFPDTDATFSEEQLEEFGHLFSNSVDLSETSLVKLSYYLNFVAEYRKRNGIDDDKTATNYMFDEMHKIVDNFQVSGTLGISGEFKSNIREGFSNSVVLDDERKRELDGIISGYVSGYDKAKAIDRLNSLTAKKKVGDSNEKIK